MNKLGTIISFFSVSMLCMGAGNFHSRESLRDCPLAINFDGMPTQIPLAESQAMFDYGKGPVRTAWFGPVEGIIALDRNSDGKIDGLTEIFGNSGNFADGFEALRKVDSNGDGQISRLDEEWPEIRLWFDANGDGIGSEDELAPLREAGIALILLESFLKRYPSINEGEWLMTSTAITRDGRRLDVIDHWFDHE